MAFQNRNPSWILDGVQMITTSAEAPAEITWAHRSNPRGNDWELVDTERVREIMKDEGPVHLMMLPPGIEVKSVVSSKDEDEEEGEKGEVDGEKKGDVDGEGENPTDPKDDDPPPPTDDPSPPDDENDGVDQEAQVSDALPQDEADNIIQVAEQVVEDAAMGDMEEPTPVNHHEDHPAIVDVNDQDDHNNHSEGLEGLGDDNIAEDDSPKRGSRRSGRGEEEEVESDSPRTRRSKRVRN